MHALSLPRLPSLPNTRTDWGRVSPHAIGRHLRHLASAGGRRAVRRALRHQDETAPCRLAERRLDSRLRLLPQRPRIPNAALFGGNILFQRSALASRALGIAQAEGFSVERLQAVTHRGDDLIGDLLHEIARPVNEYLDKVVATAEKQRFGCPNVPELLTRSAQSVAVIADDVQWRLSPPDGFFMYDLRQMGLPERSIQLAAQVLSLSSPIDYLTPVDLYRMVGSGYGGFLEYLLDDLDRLLLKYGGHAPLKAAMISDFDAFAEAGEFCCFLTLEAMSTLVDLLDPQSQLAQMVNPLKVETLDVDALTRCAASDDTLIGQWASDALLLIESTRESVNELQYPGGDAIAVDGAQFWGGCMVGFAPELEYDLLDMWYRESMECSFSYFLDNFSVNMVGRFIADSMISLTCAQMLAEYCDAH